MPEHSLSFVGHDAKWRALQRAFARGQMPQTLLITGEAHVGKWTLAQRLAQLLLCPQAATNLDENGLPTPCLKCRVCHQVAIETFPDFRVYRPIVSKTNPVRAPEALDSSAILAEVARDFFEEALFRPTTGARKVMLMQQADRMNIPAQSILLKTFEEPIETVTIILLTDSPLHLKDTIRSRSCEVRLGLAPQREIRAWLESQFPDLPPQAVERALQVANGRAGRAHREATRWQEMAQKGAVPISRADEVAQLIARIEGGSPVAALSLSEDATQLAEKWGEEDQINAVSDENEKYQEKVNSGDEKKTARALTRAKMMRFLDELSGGYRARWKSEVRNAPAQAALWADGLDQIRKTRHYILRNANTSLALDVLFGRLISAHQSPAPSGSNPRRTREIAR